MSIICYRRKKVTTSNYEKGLKLLNQLHGGHAGESIIKDMQEICPDYARITIETGFGDIMSRPQLDLKTRELAIIASCVTLGHVTLQLRAHIEAALTIGATHEEIIEVIFQTALYAGFAAATNALYIAKEIFETTKS